jgi:hypothetical protein
MKKKIIEGIVVKVTEHTIVIMCPEGTFKNIPRPPEQIPRMGEPFSYIEGEKNSRPSWLAYISVAAVFMIGILLSTLFLQSEPQASYVVAMDVNPSIEIYVDQDDTVVKVIALNQDAEKITNHLDSQHEPISQLLEEMVSRFVKEGYLSKDKDGMITTSIVPLQVNGQDISIEKISESIQGHIQQSLEKHSVMAQVTVTNDLQEYLEKAHQMKLSINKYKLYKRFVEKELDITLEEVRTGSVSQLLDLEKAKKDQLDQKENKKKAAKTDLNVDTDTKGKAEVANGSDKATQADKKTKEQPVFTGPDTNQSETSIPEQKNNEHDASTKEQELHKANQGSQHVDKESKNKSGSQEEQHEQGKPDMPGKPEKLDQQDETIDLNKQGDQTEVTEEQEEAEQTKQTELDEQTKDEEQEEDQQNQQVEEVPQEEDSNSEQGEEDQSEDSSSGNSSNDKSGSPPTNQGGTSERP